MAQHRQGDLAVTAPVGFGRRHLQPVATEFLEAYPDINLKLVLVDRLVNMIEERVDLAVRIRALAESGLAARAAQLSGQVRGEQAGGGRFLLIVDVPEEAT